MKRENYNDWNTIVDQPISVSEMTIHKISTCKMAWNIHCGGPQGATLGILEYQTADLVSDLDLYKFVNDLTHLTM